MKRSLTSVLFASAFGLGLAVIAVAPPARAIVGGTPSTAADDAVVLVLTLDPSKDTPSGQYFEDCTGTLLAPNLVLTARHCVTSSSSGSFACTRDGTIEIASGPGGRLAADFVPSDALVFVGAKLPVKVSPDKADARGKTYVHDDGKVTCNDDVALIVLDRAIPNAKIAPIRLDRGVKTDDPLTVVGWGATETSFIPNGRQRRTGVRVVDVGPNDTEHGGGALADKEFIASESVCTGDSGGPAFAADTGAVVGVVSRGENTTAGKDGSGCVGTEHTFMTTAGFHDLVTKAFGLAGATPWLEGQPAPGSAPDAGGPADDAGASAPPADAPPSSGAGGGCTMHAFDRGGAGGARTTVTSLASLALLFAAAALRRRRRSPRR